MTITNVSNALSGLSAYTNGTPLVGSASTAQTSNATTVQQAGAATNSVRAGRHPRHGPGGAIAKELQDAVTSALETAKSNPSADPNKLVESAIASVLRSHGGAKGGGPRKAGGPDPDGDGDIDAPGRPDVDGAKAPTAQNGAIAANAANVANAAAAADPAQQSFFQKLASLGIDPTQFQADFAAAVKDVQAGNPADPSAAFQSFPTGLSVDRPA